MATLDPYVETSWDTTSYVNPTNMNHIERGITNSRKAENIAYDSNNSVKDMIDDLKTNELEIFRFSTADGRYYTITFTSITEDRFPFQIWASKQGSAVSLVMGAVNNRNNINLVYFTDNACSYNQSTKTITIDLGSGAWGTALLLAAKGSFKV